MENSERKILVIGRHPEIMAILDRLINNVPEWTAYCCLADEEAYGIFNSEAIDMVLLSAGINDLEEAALRTRFAQAKPEIPIRQHFGGGSGLLYNEILETLGK